MASIFRVEKNNLNKKPVKFLFFNKHRLQQLKKAQQFLKPTLMHLMMAEAGRNM
jgi:hypothetical protein